MQPLSVPTNSVGPTAPQNDVATKIALAMRAMGVMGLPRNYEIFYEVFTGSNHELNADVNALGTKPRQEDLDRISVRHFVQNNNSLFVENVREQIANKVEEVMILMQKERLQLERYGTILNQTTDGLNKRNQITQELLQRISGIMSAATDTKIEQGRQMVSSIQDKSAELEEVKSKLEEYKKLADTDALTQLDNRRAFDKAMARIYDDPKKVMFASLIIADIDRFKQVNDRYGHPVGDRIIQHVARIVSSVVRKDMLVARTGGEEFAVIAEGLSEEALAEQAETIRKAVERMNSGKGEGANCGPITISIGTCLASEAASAEDLYTKADRALYVSKAAGRNRVTSFSALPSLPSVKNWRLYKAD